MLAAFLVHLESGRRVSPHTLAAYRRDVQRFLANLEEKEREDLRQIDAPRIKAHLMELLSSGMARTSVARHAAALRTFFRFLLDEGQLKRNPAASVRLPARKRTLPRVLTREEVGRLLEAPRGDAVTAVRDRALLETLYATGVRVSELVACDLEDLDLATGEMRVMGKGSRPRLTFLGGPAREAVTGWLAVRGRVAREGESAVFLNRFGGRLGARSVRRSLERWLAEAGLWHISPHTLRHCFASHLLEAGAALKEVQEMLGHLHLSSTQIYTRLSPRHLLAVYEHAHPRAGASPSAPGAG